MSKRTIGSSSDQDLMLNRDKWYKTHQDLLEPLFYPDPGLFRASLEKLTKDDFELKKNLTSDKATLRVLAPYLKIIHKDQKRLMESARREGFRKARDTKSLFVAKTKDQLISVVPDISEKLEMIVSIQETADVLKSLVKASSVVSYLVNPSKNEIYQSARHVFSSPSTMKWKIECGTTMAAYAAYIKEHVISNNVLEDHRFPLGLGFSGSFVKYGLCVPIKTPDDKVVAVYELARGGFDQPFNQGDIQLILAITGWMGVALLQNILYTTLVRQYELSEYLLDLTNHYHSSQANVDKTMSDLVIFARETIGSERASLFVVDKEQKGTMILEEYDQGADNSRILFKRRAKKHIDPNGSTLARVLFNQEIVNKQFKGSISDRDSVGLLRSLLCVPIVYAQNVLGAIQLTNKKFAAKFDKEDEKTLERFAKFAMLNLNHMKVQQKVDKSEIQGMVVNEMLFYHTKPCIHNQEAMTKKHSIELPDQFFTFTWYPSPDDTPKLAEMAVSMFHEVLGDSFMTLNNVPKFILTVQNCYRPNPYHNFLHGFSVAHTMANIINRYHRIFTGIERKGLMVAALCHDLDHRGYTNNYIQLTKHHLACLYDSSPLENHHFAVTKMLLQQCGMFRYFKPHIYAELITEIYECIIATDLSLYFQCRMELMKVADEKTFTFKNPNHRRLVKSLMMTACDLSGQTKPLAVSKKITEDVYEEFFQQGDIEKKMGFMPLPTMDRDKKEMCPENQVQFLTVVVLPCVETVSRIFSTLSPMVWDTKLLLKQWKDLVHLKDQDTWNRQESIAA